MFYRNISLLYITLKNDHILKLRNALIHSTSSSMRNGNHMQKMHLVEKFLKKDVRVIPSLDQLSKTHVVPSSGNPSRKKNNRGPLPWKYVRINKTYLEKITDLFSTSMFDVDVLETKMEISQVQVQPGFLALHVYWTCSDYTKHEEIKMILGRISPLLRHALMRLNIFGRVPPIVFIRDESCDTMAEIDRRLAIADFGDDYEPCVSTKHLQISHCLKKDLKDDIKKSIDEKIRELDEKQREQAELPDDIPQLQHDVYRLDRSRILNTITKGMKYSRADHRTSTTEDTVHMDYQSKFISPNIMKTKDTFSQLESTRTSDIKNWAKRFRAKEVKMKENMYPEELQESDDYDEVIDNLEVDRDYLDDYDDSGDDLHLDTDYIKWSK